MFNQKIKSLAKRYLNLKIYRILPHGLDEFEDIARSFKSFRLEMVFDVGSNTGQSVQKFTNVSPNTIIHCFEPIHDTFQILSSKIRSANISLNKFALGAKSGKIEILVSADNSYSDINSLVHGNTKAKNLKGEFVQINTLDDYCHEKAINRIDYLKIDTEGYDLEVLKGGIRMLEGHKISFVETELSMNPRNSYHVSFEELKHFLEKYDYMLFGIYEQQSEWRPEFPVLRRVNALFVSVHLETKLSYDN